MRYVIITMIAVILLLIQSYLSKRRRVALIFILPVICIATGLIYQGVSLHTILLAGMYPFLAAGGSLLLFGFLRRLDNRKNEMEHMKTQDL